MAFLMGVFILPVKAANATDSTKENALKMLSQTYNTLHKMSDGAFQAYALKTADKMEKEGNIKKADIFRALAEEGVKQDIEARLKKQIDDKSVNGLFLIWFAVADDPTWVSGIDPKDNFGQFLVFVFFSIITLDGEEAVSNF